MRKAVLYVRWIGAFGRLKYSMSKTIRFEVERTDEVACEPIRKRNGKLHSNLIGYRDVQVGLVLSEDSIFRVFGKDCGSYYKGDPDIGIEGHKTRGYLRAGRIRPDQPDSEAWAHMKNAVTAIIVYGNMCELPKELQLEVQKASLKHDLPIFTLTHDGRLV